ncbi:MAG: LysR family transcriptional regulator [Hyphomonadaceae bacterium]|nr:LysR family transcriptional regulator [Hyphomonadaceae bacterium]
MRAFAAAARLQSLRDAAAELGVTPSAVSHQVKALENWVGEPLFERGVRQVRLTARGAMLGEALNQSFDAMAIALERARRESAASTLKVATLPLFANAWMAPRLSRFEAQHPDLSLSIHTDARVYDLLAGEADVAIRNAGAPSAGLYARKLIDLRATPLCSPELAKQLDDPGALKRMTLIGLSVGRAGWADWLTNAGHPGLKPKRTITVDTMLEAVDAAVQGRGVMLALLPVIWDVPSAASLVAPFGLTPQSAGAYIIVCRSEDRIKPIVGSFIDWLTLEMRADIRRLMRLERQRLTLG